jgi:hypothetical protein
LKLETQINKETSCGKRQAACSVRETVGIWLGFFLRAPNTPFLPDVPVAKRLKANYRLQYLLHGMEEVVGDPDQVHNLQNLTADDADLTDDR